MKYAVLVEGGYECIVCYSSKKELKDKLTEYIDGRTGVSSLPRTWYEGEIDITNEDGQQWTFYWTELPLI